MITPQGIREKTFEKAVFGGYDMATVDAFLDEVAGDLALLQKENSVLKSKMKVLVDKVEEYRENEDALRTAVLSAQRLGLMIEKEAKEKAEAIIAEANDKAQRISAEMDQEVALERSRLAESKNASAKFLDSMDMLCRRQLEFLKKIGEMDFVKDIRSAEPEAEPASAQPAAAPVQEPPRTEIHETVNSIEQTVVPVEDDELPTRRYNPVQDELPEEEDELDQTTLFQPKSKR